MPAAIYCKQVIRKERERGKESGRVGSRLVLDSLIDPPLPHLKTPHPLLRSFPSALHHVYLYLYLHYVYVFLYLLNVYIYICLSFCSDRVRDRGRGRGRGRDRSSYPPGAPHYGAARERDPLSVVSSPPGALHYGAARERDPGCLLSPRCPTLWRS